MRKDVLAVGEIYHIFNKSIAEFNIFNNTSEFLRMLNVIRYYQMEKPLIRFSEFLRSSKVQLDDVNISFSDRPGKEKLIEIIAYCLMPTHIHLILKQLKEDGISIFMNCILNSYTRYFNIRHKRKGPLWEGRFKNILVTTDEQLIHLTRYIHLNPVTAYLVDKPEKWPASSYREYLLKVNERDKICKYDEILNIDQISYKDFVEDRISYQRELAKIKNLLIENTFPAPILPYHTA
ncbi:MAG: transposase [Candidatus Omnitrophota bacterium]|nr:transposase [Candidatus Omnitrophota bacterium]